MSIILLQIVVLFNIIFYMLAFSFSKTRCIRRSCRFVSENRVEAFNFAKESAVKMPCIILVNPFLDANVGSVSRSMLNFGMYELRVVNPRCDILSETAQTLAVGSVEILKNAKVFSSLKDCIADLDIVVATTARKHTINQIVNTPREMATEVVNTRNSLNVGIMFGRERDGLNNEELALANRRVGIPTFEHYGVLNMAQAVNIIGYECWQQALIVREQITDEHRAACESDASMDGDISNPCDSKETERPATSGEVNKFLERLLENVGNSERNGHRRLVVANDTQLSTADISSSVGESDGNEVVDPESSGVSGLSVKNEDRIKAVFRRVRIMRASLIEAFLFLQLTVIVLFMSPGKHKQERGAASARSFNKIDQMNMRNTKIGKHISLV